MFQNFNQQEFLVGDERRDTMASSRFVESLYSQSQ